MGKLGRLFFTFLKIGAFTFGGGYAMIALLETEFIDRRKWMTREPICHIFLTFMK